MNLVCLKPKIHKRHYKERAEEFAKYIEEIGQTDLFEDTG